MYPIIMLVSKEVGARHTRSINFHDLTELASILSDDTWICGSIPGMTTSVIDNTPLFELRADIWISATTEDAYAVVSDLGRSGEWSPECLGGDWVSGEPATVGAVFRGKNLRREDVVAWAPLIRGVWHTECKVIAAEPGRTFQWMMLTHAREDQESVWGFDVRTADGGCRLTHHFRMGAATAGIHKIVADLDETGRKNFIVEWTTKLEQDLGHTLKRIKDVIETA